MLLLLLPERIVGVQRVTLLRRRGGACFAVWSVAGGLFVGGGSGGVGGGVFGVAGDAWAGVGSGSSCASATAAGRDGGGTAFVLPGEVLFGQFLFATALLLGLPLAVFFLFLQLEGECEVVVFLLAEAALWLRGVVLRTRFLT